MDEEYCYWKKSGQIPAFGNWEHANDLPITQYFECARQAGLQPRPAPALAADLHAKPSLKTSSGGGDKQKQVRKKVVVVGPDYVTAPPSKQLFEHRPKHSSLQGQNRRQRQVTATATLVKPVDEDLYKIPPELLRASKRKRRLGLFSRCLVPACMV
ncbi:uncharacterized protein LOC127798413 [Diospyros lotus]|uniref:uncharacterized protein LOC127798413 n=1 Tax=Diospyros lotus TaxID=55363 RepID=UPI00224D4503|nr:uncharacterized protein LOC127798413 [Diospyros lotus]